MLEKMDAFFEARLEGYDAHMLEAIEGAREFYPFTASQLPQEPGVRILDLGCGTGLELEYYLAGNPTAQITGIDLSQGMLDALRKKFPGADLTLIRGSYFDTPLGSGYDAAVSVESLHHFTQEEKTALYRRLHGTLKESGFFLLTDYFSLSDEEELHWQQELWQLKKAQCLPDDAFYHFDTPLTVDHETEALLAAGFRQVDILRSWGATYTLKAIR